MHRGFPQPVDQRLPAKNFNNGQEYIDFSEGHNFFFETLIFLKAKFFLITFPLTEPKISDLKW